MNVLRNRLGFALRETGQALEKIGCVFQGINSHEEEITRLHKVVNTRLKVPSAASSAWIAPSAQVSGDVTVGDNTSIWYNCTVRGDNHHVSIGQNTNLQDGVSVGSLSPSSSPTAVGSYVSVGHGAVLQGCTVGDRSLIGMNAVLQEGCKVESGAIVAAGAVLEPGSTVPSGELWAGNPAKRLRELKPEEAEYLKTLPARYQELAIEHNQILQQLRNKVAAYTGGSLSP
eukprot:GHRR01002894.1.p1 GENE.GHRR01002894.1~~GHRR01002894.1.p1  ORF type:complete len:229 (+),score=57.00 GHRR01002894.1:179-865(+)